MVSVYLWFTFGWMLWGKFENEHQAKMFVSKYPKKQWRIQLPEQQDNFISIIGTELRNSKTQQED